MSDLTHSDEVSDADLVAKLRQLVDDQEGGDAVVLVQRQLFNRVVGRLDRLSRRSASNTAGGVSVAVALLDEFARLRRKHSNPIGDAYNCGQWDMAVRLEMATKRILSSLEPIQAGGDEPVAITAVFETVDGPIIGSTSATIKRIERQDDGSITVVIDYWPPPAAPVSAEVTVTDEMVERFNTAWAKQRGLPIETLTPEQQDRWRNSVRAALTAALASRNAPSTGEME